MTEQDFAPRRRGRPPLNPDAPAAVVNEAATENVTDTAADAPTQRRRRASVGGHALKLSAPTRPGWVRRWFNDQKNRIADALDLGYSFVEAGGIRSSDVGSRTSRLVGTQEGGGGLNAYLMETPDELYAQGVAEKEAHNRQIDEALVAGRDSTGQMNPSETYGHGSIG